MLTKETYYQILDLHNEYATNEVYRRLNNVEADKAYELITKNKYHAKSLINKALDYFKTLNFLNHIKTFLGWLIIGYIIGFGYIFYSNDIFNIIQTAPEQAIAAFDISGLHKKVAIYMVLMCSANIALFYLKKRNMNNDKIDFQPMELEKAYYTLKVDKYDSIAYIKLQVSKILQKNKNETNKTINAYLTIMQQYDFENTNTKPTLIPVIYLFVKNMFIAFFGSISRSVVFVPVLYLWAWYYYNLTMNSTILPAINDFLNPVYNYVVSLPFSQFIPFMDYELNHVFALFIVIGIILFIYELPLLILECYRQLQRAIHFGQAYTLADEIELPLVTVYSNRFKNKFNITRIAFIIYTLLYLAKVFLIRV